jgi:hypothetical protein
MFYIIRYIHILADAALLPVNKASEEIPFHCDINMDRLVCEFWERHSCQKGLTAISSLGVWRSGISSPLTREQKNIPEK